MQKGKVNMRSQRGTDCCSNTNCCLVVVQLLFICCSVVVQLLFNCCSVVVQLLFNLCSIVVQLLSRPKKCMDASLSLFEFRMMNGNRAATIDLRK